MNILAWFKRLLNCLALLCFINLVILVLRCLTLISISSFFFLRSLVMYIFRKNVLLIKIDFTMHLIHALFYVFLLEFRIFCREAQILINVSILLLRRFVDLLTSFSFMRSSSSQLTFVSSVLIKSFYFSISVSPKNKPFLCSVLICSS